MCTMSIVIFTNSNFDLNPNSNPKSCILQTLWKCTHLNYSYLALIVILNLIQTMDFCISVESNSMEQFLHSCFGTFFVVSPGLDQMQLEMLWLWVQTFTSRLLGQRQCTLEGEA